MKITKLLLLLVAACLALSATAAGNKTITVKNATDFINALGSERTIVIDSKKPLNITEALNKMIDKGEMPIGPTYYDAEEALSVNFNVTYCDQFDGNGLQVRGLKDLTIMGKKGATLVASPRYANVMEFINCSGLTIENVVMGHTEEGYCDKGVVEFDGCVDLTVNDCDFYGCGTEGFVFNNCYRVAVNRSCVHDCSYYTMHIKDCVLIRFNDCTFRDNREFEQLSVSNSWDIFFTGCAFNNLKGKLFNFTDYVQFFGCSFYNCELPSMQHMDEYFTSDYGIMAYCNYLNGGQPAKPGAVKPAFKEGKWTDGKTVYIVVKSDDYRYVFTSDEGDSFAINTISVEKNEYTTGFDYPYENKYGRNSVRYSTENGYEFLRINDDGGELIKSLFYIGDKK